MGVRYFKIVTILILVIEIVCAWQENIQPKISVKLGNDKVLQFLGSENSIDNFKVVLHDGHSLLVGSSNAHFKKNYVRTPQKLNVMYNLSISNLMEQRRLEFYPPDDMVIICKLKGQSQNECHNFIRILVIKQPDILLICGTNSFRPLCRTFEVNEKEYNLLSQTSGEAISPYNPLDNSTFIFADHKLYTGTVVDFSSNDPIIYREPLQTEQYDTNILNEPNFVGSVEEGDFVYFFFRETAVEFLSSGKSIVSRVGRVCKSDKGGYHHFRNRWTSFLKARLNCSIPGDDPFYFNEIQSISDLVEGRYGNTISKIIYGVFTTTTNSTPGSAICAFSLNNITGVFEGTFKEQNELTSNWAPVDKGDIPVPRPGKCQQDSRTLPYSTLDFGKTHPLMNDNVPAFFKQPVLIRVSANHQFTAIAVDSQIRTPDGKAYDVIFVGTDDGKIIKMISTESGDFNENVSSLVVEELEMLANNEPILNLEIIRTQHYDYPIDGHYDDSKLVIVTATKILAIKLYRCNSERITSCEECVALQDPYCAWHKTASKCRSHGSPFWTYQNYFYQNITTGQHTMCLTK